MSLSIVRQIKILGIKIIENIVFMKDISFDFWELPNNVIYLRGPASPSCLLTVLADTFVLIFLFFNCEFPLN